MIDMKQIVQEGWKIIRYNKGDKTTEEEIIATEYPLTVYVNDEEFATLVCTPTNIEELVIGFLASEGFIRFYDEVKEITVDKDRGFAYVTLNKELEQDRHASSKRFIGSCCGKSRQFYFQSDVMTAKTVTSKLTIPAENCLALMEALQSKSNAFQKTGGVHNAALCTIDELLTIRTDIGRHNALDKIYGYILKEKIPLSDKVIAFSGRISSEVLLKISKMGIGIIISKSAPTDLALNLAEDLGITAIGFARRNTMNVYTHHERII